MIRFLHDNIHILFEAQVSEHHCVDISRLEAIEWENFAQFLLYRHYDKLFVFSFENSIGRISLRLLFVSHYYKIFYYLLIESNKNKT